MSTSPLLLLLSLLYAHPSRAVGILESNGNDLINDVGEGTIINVVTENGVENIELIPVREAEESSPRAKRAAAYQVPALSISQDGESRTVSWKEASGPLPVTHYNIYRTFTIDIPFNVTLLKPVATISSNEPRQYTWKDTCRTEQRSVRYAVTAVDIAGREHTSDVIISNLLPLVGSFVSNTPIKYPVHAVLDGRCCVLHHSMVFNPHLSQFLLAYDCDYDADGNGDDVFVVFLDYTGNVIKSARSIKVPFAEFTVQERPSVAYNLQLKQYLVLYHFRMAVLNSNKQVIISRVIQTSPKTVMGSPRMSLTGALPGGGAADLRKSSVIYNPVTNGYVVSAELVLTNSVQIVFSQLDSNGQQSSSGVIFEHNLVDVLQTALIYDQKTETIVFVSQLDKSHQSLRSYGKHGIIVKSLPVSANSSSGRRTHLIGFTRVKESSISIHRETATGCLRVCYLVDRNNTGLTKTTCTKVCSSGSDGWLMNSDDVKLCTCAEKATNPHIIEYPVSGSIFGVWEESNQTSHHLHGYYASAQYFVQTPPAAIQKYPLATYRSSDGQICVVWQHHSSHDTCRAIAFRCFEASRHCNDPCCCSFGDHCDACGSHICDSNADCTVDGQCKCRNSLGFSGDGYTCHFDPCTPSFHSCQRDVDCVVWGESSVCLPGADPKTLDALFGSGSRGPCADGVHDCHANATCSITVVSGRLSYTCGCKPGHFGDGKLCLEQSKCHPNAAKVKDQCLCNKGFVGNGYFCCPANFGDEDVTLGSSVTLQFQTECLGPYTKFRLSFQWYHRSSLIKVSEDSAYALQKRGTAVVISNIKKKHLGRYKMRFSIELHGPYEVSAEINLLQTGGSCTCGLSGRNDSKMSRPERAEPEFPWQAMLCGRRDSVFCGGVMISKCCILTAAHCVAGYGAGRMFNASSSKSLTVCLGRKSGDCQAGVHKDPKEGNDERPQCFQAHQIVVHQDYNETTLDHDIAMIMPKSSHCLKCRAGSVRPVCLPKATRDTEFMTTGSKAWLSGWGQIHKEDSASTTLRKAKINPQNDQVCEDGPSQGDDGGPLMVKNTQFDDRFILVGLVSWRQGCGAKGPYSMYTDVLHHIDWIYQTCNWFS